MTQYFLDFDAIAQQFRRYLQKMNIQQAIDMVLQDAEATRQELSHVSLSHEDLQQIEAEILPEIAVAFANKFTSLDERFSYDDEDDNLNSIFSIFCKINSLNEDLAKSLAMLINSGTAYDANDEDDKTEDDDDFIFQQFEKLTDDERREKIKAFLRKLANVGNDSKQLRPFLSNLKIGTDPYSNERAKVSKVNHYGPGHSPNEDVRTPLAAGLFLNEAAIQSPNSSGQGFDKDHDLHPLHKAASKFGYSYSHTTPVHQRDGSVLHHHTWHKREHKIGAYAHDTKWTSKVSSASGHSFQGVGTVALDRHLKNKEKRYGKLPEEKSQLPSTPIMEMLVDPEADARVQAYARWMNTHPASAFGTIGGSYEVPSPVKDLQEAAKLRAAAEKRSGYGKEPENWDVNDARTHSMRDRLLKGKK
jgi:hypothetical protein